MDVVRDRRDFLEQNRENLTQQMMQCGLANPVGVVADVRDFHGRQFAIAGGLTEAEIDALIAKHEGSMIPTVTCVLTWEQARKIMPLTSPTAEESLNAAWRLCSLTGQALTIAIMGKGNSYALVSFPRTVAEAMGIPKSIAEGPIFKLGRTDPTPDGQNRHDGYRPPGSK
jgi:hypothetical protein